jgi:TonB-linked SusC/RagA family outer membrane protein
MTLNKLFALFLLLFFISSNLFAQSSTRYTISGTVIEANSGEPLPGSNIGIVNTVLGTSAGTDGEFEFTANLQPGEYRFRITFIGYSTRVITATLGSEQDVELGSIELQPDIIGSEEIVVTGASGAVSKQQLGNAISSVNAESIESSGAVQIDQALSGKVAGALVQQNSGDPAGGISIRLRGPSSLLGSADPLYIIDGVIVNNDSPELIDIGGTAQNRLVDINPNDIERIEVVKGAAAAALYGSRANNGVVQIFTKRGQSGEPKLTYSTNIQINNVRKTIPVNMAQVNNDGTPNPDIERFDFQDFIFRTAVGSDQNLSISGGSEDTRYFISGSYFSNQGIVEGNNFERITTRLNLDLTLTNWANLSIGINYSNSNSVEIPNGGLNSSFGALTGFIFGPNTFDPRPDPETGEFPQNSVLANPLEVIEKYDFTQNIDRIIGNAKLTLLPLDDVSVDYSIGLDTYDQASRAFIPSGTTAPGLATGFGRRAERSFLQLNNDLNIRYNSFVKENLELTALVGGSLQYEEVEQFASQATQFSPFINVVGGGSNFDQPSEFLSEIVVYGLFAQTTLGFQDRYFLTAAGRFDASSVFGPDDRWQFFPKVSGSYILTNEPFWKENFSDDFISNIKLRGSIGASGGQTSISAFDRFTTFSPQSISGRSALLPSTQQGALNVKPERQREIEFGADVNFFNDRVAVEFTWFNQLVDDLLLFRSSAPSSGFLSRLGNFGELENKGIELLVRAVPINTSNIRWTTTGTFSTYENEVSGIEGGRITIPDSFSQVAAINGEPLGVFFSSAFERDENGEIAVDGDGLPLRAAESQIIGDPNPDWIGSLINEVKVGNWDFRAQLDASYGNDVFNFTRRLGAFFPFGTHGDLQKELEGDLPDGYNARVFGIFEHWVEDGSYLKLREISASYTFYPETFGLESLRLSVKGRNLFSIDSYSGYDPETNVGGQRTAVRGFDFVQVPIPRTFQFGIRANF